ncbi:MAG: DUF4124 domain-containing protein [Nitrospiria bacterium]
MRLSFRVGFVVVQVIAVLAMMIGLADSTVYTWQDETGALTFSDDPNSAPAGVQAKVFINESTRMEVSEARLSEKVPGQHDAVPSTIPTQGEFAVHLARELGYSGDQTTPEEAARILSDIPIIPPFGGWDLDAAMTPEITSRLRAATIMAPQKGWISVTPEQARHAFDSAAALLGVPIPANQGSALLEYLPPDQGILPLSLVTQGEFAVRLSHELGLGQDLTDVEATRILSDLRIAPPLGIWEHNAAMNPDLTSRLRTLTVAASQMEWISVSPEQALFAFDSAAALSGVSIPFDPEKIAASPRTIVVPPLVYVSPPPYFIAPYYTWVTIPNGFLWHGSTVKGFFALHSAHINIHFFNGHRFSFKSRFVRHHFLNNLRGRHLAKRRMIRRPTDRTVSAFSTPYIRPFPPFLRHQDSLSDRKYLIRKRRGGRSPIESHFVNKHIKRRSTNYLLRRIPPYARAVPRVRSHQRGKRDSLHFKRPHQEGFHDRKKSLRRQTGWKEYRSHHLPPASQNIAKRRTQSSAPHLLTTPPQKNSPSAFRRRERKGKGLWNASGRHGRR